MTENTDFHIRKAILADISQLRELFVNTVLTINRRDYSLAEVQDWASCGESLSRWQELLSNHQYFVAENTGGTILGFASINNEGYLHSMFVHKDFQQRGIATQIYQTIENYARKQGVEKITSEVSITARTFFDKQGFRVDKKQIVQAKELKMTNYKMSKQL